MTVAQRLVNYLYADRLVVKGAARCNVPGTDQRHSMAYTSTVDLEEAYRSAQKAVLLAAAEESGYMATILRSPGSIYVPHYDRVPLAEVAGADRAFPSSWITADGNDVTDEFVRYARPLVGEGMVSLPMIDGRQRLARIRPVLAEQKLPQYTPQADRKA